MFRARLTTAASKADVPNALNNAIVDICADAIKERGVFSIALSGGSLPAFLSTMAEAFKSKDVDPKFDSWHIILADERCVVSTDPDSNLGSLETNMFATVPVPKSQIYGINEEKLAVSTESVATDYEVVVRNVLEKSGNQLDLAVLGFGPDGHTCSLFPGHALLDENEKWVAPIEDSPKPPPQRITLTFPVLNSNTRHVIFCGAGASKAPILQAIFSSVTKKDGTYSATLANPAPYPCGMVQPNSEGVSNTLTYVVDEAAIEGLSVTE